MPPMGILKTAEARREDLIAVCFGDNATRPAAIVLSRGLTGNGWRHLLSHI